MSHEDVSSLSISTQLPLLGCGSVCISSWYTKLWELLTSNAAGYGTGKSAAVICLTRTQPGDQHARTQHALSTHSARQPPSPAMLLARVVPIPHSLACWQGNVSSAELGAHMAGFKLEPGWSPASRVVLSYHDTELGVASIR